MLESYRMDNSNTLKGKWATSLNKLVSDEGVLLNTAVPGNLELFNGKIYLDLNGRLSDKILAYSDDIPNIYGYLSNGLYVVLEKCFLTSQNFISDGYNVEKYVSNYAYIISINNGNPFILNDKEIHATRVKFSFTFLDDWYNIELPKHNDKCNKDGFSIEYTNNYSNENNFIIMNGDYTIKIRRDVNRMYSYNKGSYVEMNHYIEIFSENYKSKSIKDFYDIMFWFMNLIDYLSQFKRHFTYVTFYMEDENNRFQSKLLDNGDYVYEKPMYYGRYIFQQLDNYSYEPNIQSLRLNDIKEDLNEVIYNWFNQRDKIISIMELYNQNHNPMLDIESFLVNQIIMMERIYDNFYYEPRETLNEEEVNLNQVITDIKKYMNENNIEISIQKKVINRLECKKSNNLNYKEKLAFILKNTPEQFKVLYKIVDEDWDKNPQFESEFANKLKATRHYHVHGTGKNKHKARLKTFEELFNASQLLECVIYYHILILLGLGEDKVFNYPFIKNKLSRYKC